MEKQKRGLFQRLSLSARMRRKLACLLTILILLAANGGFIPTISAASLASASKSVQASNQSGNETKNGSLINQTEAGTSAQNEGVAGNVYAGQNPYSNALSSAVPFDTQKALTESVYSNNPGYIDQVIDYSAIPGALSAVGTQVYQPGLHMKRVIHMPRRFVASNALSPGVSNSVYGQSAEEQNSNNSSVANSVYGNSNGSGNAGAVSGSVYASSASASNPSVITELQSGIDEDGLNLVDISQSSSQNQSGSVAGSVYGNAETNSLPQANSSQPGVASSAYAPEAGANAFPIRNTSGRFTAGFSRQACNALLQFSYNNASLTLGPVNSASSSGSVNKNRITYQGIYPGTDLKYTLGSEYLKESLTIKKYTGQTDFYFQLGVSNAVYKPTSDSTIVFYDPVSGAPLFYMPRPFAMDNVAASDADRSPCFSKDGASRLPAFHFGSGHKYCDLSFELTEDGLLKVSIDPAWLQSAVYPVIIDPSIYLFDAGFYRPSTAYTMEGVQAASGVPRYEPAKFNQGITLEEGTTNLLTANQSNVETDLTGFNVFGVATLTRVTSDHWEGDACLQIACPGILIQQMEGTYLTPIAATAGQNYVGSAWIKGPAGKPITICLWNANHYSMNGLFTTNFTGSWQRLVTGAYAPQTSANVRLAVFGGEPGSMEGPITFYLDGLQIEQKPYATSWVTGGVTRSGEIVSIPTTSVFTKSSWSVELNYKPTAITGNLQILWFAYIPSTQEEYLLSVDPYNSGGLELLVNSTASGTLQAYGVVSSFTLAPGNAYDIVATGDGSTLNLYCNGQSAGSAAYREPAAVLPPVMGVGCLSYLYNGTLYYGYEADGIVDDLRISNRARTAAEVLSAYQSNQALPVDASTTCKLSFDGSVAGYASGQTATGTESYWNYTGTSLGGGWNASVNTWNLNLVLTKQLFSIPGRGINIGESISYNSQGNKSWTFGNFTGVFENPDGSVTYTKADGGSYTFTPNGSGGYTAPAGVYLTLTKNGAGNFTIKDKYGDTYNYVKGKPYQFIDRNNNTTTFTYNASGQLYQVTDASGRPITYTYDLAGRITYVTDPEGRSYQFGYQNNLTSVTDPAGNIYTLSYDSNGHLASFTDPLNRVTTFNINSGGQLLSYNDARSNGQNVYTTTLAQSLQGSTMVTTVTDPGNRAMTYYHNNSTGNLSEKQDGVGDSWNYTWSNNNLTQAQDTKGTTSYTYDGSGSILTKTTTVDSNPSDNLVETMTYNSYSEPVSKKDNSSFNNNAGRETDYTYNGQGNLLSQTDPNDKAANSYNYDQYGNCVQYNPDVLGYHNLIQNGSMEIAGTGGNLLATWGQSGTAATVIRDNSWDPHGNYSLKISNTSGGYCYFQQQFDDSGWSIIGYYNGLPVLAGDALTLKSEVQLNNVTGGGGSGGNSPFGTNSGSGLIIGYLFHSDYGDYGYVYSIVTGTGTTTVVLPSGVPWLPAGYGGVPYNRLLYHVAVYVGLNNSSGAAWFDGVQVLDKGNGSQDRVVSEFNSVENSSFEYGTSNWTLGGGAAVSSDTAWEGSSSLKVTTAGTTYQDVPTHPGETLTFSGMIDTSSVSGSGAYCRVDYYDALNNLISGASVQTGYITGSQGWTRLSSMANAPANANHARIQCILSGSGIAYFDDVKLIPVDSEQYTYDTPSNYNNPGNYTGGNYVVLSQDALGIQNAYGYDPNVGNQVAHADPLNHHTYYSYDSLNHLVQVTDPLSKNAYYQYDPASNIIYTRDPRSASSSDSAYSTYYGPNSLNKLATLTDPLSQSATYTYDNSGNLTGVSLANGLSETLIYDNANRLSRVTLNNGTYYNYSYDGAGELTGVTDQSGASYSWSYDGAHRVTGTTDPLGLAISYSWDKSGNLTGESGSGYSGISYYYDGGDNVYEANVPGGMIYYSRDDEGHVFNVEYNPYYIYNGNLTYTPGQRVMTYLPNGWCASIQDLFFPQSSGYSYGYNADGTVNGYTSWAGTDNFTYDNDGRLFSWSYTPSAVAGGSSRQESYTYDAAGNLLTKGSRAFIYNSANEIASETNNGAPVSGISYDANGNMTSDGSLNYKYNALNQLIRVNNRNTDGSDGSLVATYTYNHDGARRSKVTSQGTTNYGWDASGNLIKESGPNGAYYYYYASGKLIAFTYNGQMCMAHDNLRGDIISLSVMYNGGNSVSTVNWCDYDPWGNAIWDSEIIPLPFKYAGYYYDSETGLYYVKSRYYSPTLGRFLTRDDHKYIKDKDPQTLNLYEYCDDNPVSNTDPSGTFVGVDDAAEAAIAILVIGGLSVAAILGNPYAAQDRAALLQAASKAINLPAWRKVTLDMGHILSGHGSGGDRGGPDNNRFPDWMTSAAIAKAILQAYRYGQVLGRQGDRVFMEGPWDKMNIQMWVNTATKEIETAWPK